MVSHYTNMATNCESDDIPCSNETNKTLISDCLVFSKAKEGWSYNRDHSPSSIRLSKILLKGHNLSRGYGCEIFPSGMASIACTLNALIQGIMSPKWPNCTPSRQNLTVNLICATQLYCSTVTLTGYVSTLTNVKLYHFDMANVDGLVSILRQLPKDNMNIILSESCSNPDGLVFPFTKITELRSHFQFVLIIDNTWLSHVILNPFTYDADIVVCSMTKYYSAGKVLSGYVMGKNQYMTNIKYYAKIMGNHVSPYEVDIIIDQVKTIEQRLIQANTNTMYILTSLKNKTDISHPSLNYSDDLFRHHNDQILFPSVFTMLVPFQKEQTITKLQSLNSVIYKTSYGGDKTRIDNYPKSKGHGTMIRISVGYNHTRQELDNIIRDLQSMFST
jgi:cystathionine beta-lyase/cystathionine gamma-synthase